MGKYYDQVATMASLMSDAIGIDKAAEISDAESAKLAYLSIIAAQLGNIADELHELNSKSGIEETNND